MMIVNILIGLAGLGFVVFVHELGHMLVAKAVGIEVQAFSLGWGRKLVGVTWKGTEYRISVFPLGGYCKMKGEQSYAQALDEERDSIPREEGSFFAAAPWRRILTLLAGPVANIVLAIVILSVVWWGGFTVESYENRIVLASDYASTAELQGADVSATASPADQAGLQTGDVILAIDGNEIRSYSELQQTVAQNARTTLTFTVLRDGRRVNVQVTPELVTETGAGYIGVYPWVEPVVGSVASDSLASQAGLQAGDRIVSVDGEPVPHAWEFRRLLEQSDETASLGISRNGSRLSIEVPARVEALNQQIAFQTVSRATPDYNVWQAIGRGTTESVRILTVSVRSLRLLFQGVELTSAVAGPVRISYFIGDVATSGFRVGFATGLRSLANFLALLSVVLFFMNLLPIPVLDGGQIVLAGFEWIRGRTPHPKTIYRYQMIGSIMVFALLFFALFGDILFLAGR